MDELSKRARALAAALEPVAGQVYFAPESHAEYEKLGFHPSPGDFGGVAGPDGAAYFCSRGSVMGQVSGEVVVAAFAVFNPAVVVPLVAEGWDRTDAPTICAARDRGAVGQLTRILGPDPAGLHRAWELLGRAVEGLRPEGKPLYSGLRALGLPGDPVGDMWRMADMLREFRGDAHTASWTSRWAGRDRDRAADRALLGPAAAHLREDPLVERTRPRRRRGTPGGAGRLAGGTLTGPGRGEREEIEASTDRQCRPIVDALGEDLDDLLGVLRPWGAAIRDARGYPAAGPHDLADRSHG